MQRKIPTVAGLLLAMTYAHGTAQAITADDVLEKMGDKERWGYLTGLIDMMSYQEVLAGNEARAQCISDWFYNQDETVPRIFATLSRYSNLAPEGILIQMAKNACGAPAPTAQKSNQ